MKKETPAERVKFYLVKNGLKQKVVAEKCGFNPNIFGMMISGKRKMTVDELEIICAVLNVAPSEFIKPDYEKEDK